MKKQEIIKNCLDANPGPITLDLLQHILCCIDTLCVFEHDGESLFNPDRRYEGNDCNVRILPDGKYEETLTGDTIIHDSIESLIDSLQSYD